MRSVLVECFALKPCWVGERGMCGFISLSISRSSIFDGLHKSDIGRYEVGSIGGLLGFRMGMIFPIFHMLGIALWFIE